ncbi:U2af splicing factor protein 1 [Aphelenchoides avenae]|nr:U2af splicing factor protein 1 [Aphelenchus avenae]
MSQQQPHPPQTLSVEPNQTVDGQHPACGQQQTPAQNYNHQFFAISQQQPQWPQSSLPAVGPSVTYQSRRLYVSNIPPDCNEDALLAFFNEQMLLCGLAQAPGNPVLACRIDPSANCATIDFRSTDETTACMALDGIYCVGQQLKICRPHSSQPMNTNFEGLGSMLAQYADYRPAGNVGFAEVNLTSAAHGQQADQGSHPFFWSGVWPNPGAAEPQTQHHESNAVQTGQLFGRLQNALGNVPVDEDEMEELDDEEEVDADEPDQKKARKREQNRIRQQRRTEKLKQIARTNQELTQTLEALKGELTVEQQLRKNAEESTQELRAKIDGLVDKADASRRRDMAMDRNEERQTSISRNHTGNEPDSNRDPRPASVEILGSPDPPVASKEAACKLAAEILGPSAENITKDTIGEMLLETTSENLALFKEYFRRRSVPGTTLCPVTMMSIDVDFSKSNHFSRLRSNDWIMVPVGTSLCRQLDDPSIAILHLKLEGEMLLRQLRDEYAPSFLVLIAADNGATRTWTLRIPGFSLDPTGWPVISTFEVSEYRFPTGRGNITLTALPYSLEELSIHLQTLLRIMPGPDHPVAEASQVTSARSSDEPSTSAASYRPCDQESSKGAAPMEDLSQTVKDLTIQMDSHQIDFIHHVFETVVNLLSLVFNSFLLYLIARHSNFGSPVYQTLLAIDAGLDLVLAFFVFLGQTVVITGGGYLVYISNGFLNGWSHQLDMMLIFLWLWLIHLNVMWIPIQFIYRYTFICLSETLRRKEEEEEQELKVGVPGPYLGFQDRG